MPELSATAFYVSLELAALYQRGADLDLTLGIHIDHRARVGWPGYARHGTTGTVPLPEANDNTRNDVVRAQQPFDESRRPLRDTGLIKQLPGFDLQERHEL